MRLTVDRQPPESPASIEDGPTVAATGSQGGCAAASIVAESTAQPRDTARASVLVVDDDPRGARLVAAHLTNEGYRVRIAASASEAQCEINRDLPDLILCDVCLPEVDGIELTRWVRAAQNCANLPIALMTASDDGTILARGLEAGADDFLAKPVNRLELRTRVRSLLRSKVLADELVAREQAARPFGAIVSPALIGDVDNRAGSRLPLVVIIEDNIQDCRLMQAFLADVGCETRLAHSCAEGLALLRELAADLVVVDLLLPDASGYDVISTLKEDSRRSPVPILVVSALCDVADRVRALELGADDFVVKGSERAEFAARVRRLLRLKQALDQIARRCDQALSLAATDSLTGLNTHGFLRATLDGQLRCARRFGKPFSLVFADIDHFKQVNDRHGHAVGDAVLRAVAEALRNEVRSSDTLVRYGGEEFVILLPQTERNEAVRLAERIRKSVAELTVPFDSNQPQKVTMSLGVATFPCDAADGESLVQCGDDAMYQAKRSGRNRTIAYGDALDAELATARILVVDDEERNLRLLQAYLSPEGYELLYAHDGAEAIQIAQKQRPDLLIMDALMPVLSGYDACRRLKQDPRTQLLPIVLVTALSAREDKLRGIEAGADDFLGKPIDKLELTTRVRALLRQKRGTDLLEDAETVVFALARTVEGRDPLLGDHVERVAHYAVSLGKALGLKNHELDALRRAGIVHDIGKIAIPDAIVLKPGKLSAEERSIMQRHPEIGYKLLLPLRTFGAALPAVHFHHERRDGSGYPLGLRGDEIPLIAQIVAIADVYDALSAARCYRSAMEPSKVVEILRDEVRRGFHDPDLMDQFLTIVLSNSPEPTTSGALTPAALETQMSCGEAR